MIALARGLGGAVLRPRLLAALVAAVAAASAPIALASYAQGAFPLISGAVRALVFTGGAFMAVGALAATVPRASGAETALFLAGLSTRRVRAAGAIAALFAALAVCFAATAIAIGLAAALATADGRELTATTALHGPGWWLGIGAISAAGLALAGFAIGTVARNPLGALAAVAGLTGLGLVVPYFGQFDPALYLRALLPTGSLYTVLGDFDDARSGALFRVVIPLAYLIVPAALILRRPGAEAALDARSAEPKHRADTYAARWAPLALLAAALIAFGAVVPQRVAKEVPWWLRGDWIGRLATGTASQRPIEAYLEAVLRGDRAAERALVLGSPADALDPVVRYMLGETTSVQSFQYTHDETAAPGTAQVGLVGDEELTLHVCAVPDGRRWQITDATLNTWRCVR